MGLELRVTRIVSQCFLCVLYIMNQFMENGISVNIIYT